MRKDEAIEELKKRVLENAFKDVFDEELILVLADALLESGDGVGEIVVLDHAIRNEVDPVKKAELSELRRAKSISLIEDSLCRGGNGEFLISEYKETESEKETRLRMILSSRL